MPAFRLPIGTAATIVPADTAWLFVAAAMVLLMAPGLAFFYGGLVRAKNALNTMMMCLGAAAAVAVTWVLAGYSFAFGGEGDWFGGLQHLALSGVDLSPKGTIPHLLFMIFQATFAMIAAGCISGAVVERMRFDAFVLFVSAWALVVYAPVCHWVWGGGWLARLGALDFAGGTVVHINAGVTAAVLALVLGPRRDHGRQALLPHNVPSVLLGAALLWFGWLGFNGGSALAADGVATLAFTNTILAPAAALLVWMLLDARRLGQATAVGAATAIVVGLVAVTPAAGFVPPLGALAIGALAVFPSYFALIALTRSRFDDSLDVLAAHGIGGAVGALLTGVFASSVWGGTAGLFEGGVRQVWVQAVGIVVPALYCAAVSFVLLKVIGWLVPLRVDAAAEGVGLDVAIHGERAYADGEGALLIPANTLPRRRDEPDRSKTASSDLSAPEEAVAR